MQPDNPPVMVEPNQPREEGSARHRVYNNKRARNQSPKRSVVRELPNVQLRPAPPHDLRADSMNEQPEPVAFKTVPGKKVGPRIQ